MRRLHKLTIDQAYLHKEKMKHARLFVCTTNNDGKSQQQQQQQKRTYDKWH